MKLRTIVVGPVSCNCAIVACPDTGEAAIIDPGGDADRIASTVQQMGVDVKALLHTHGHFDHMMATREMTEQWRAPVAIHENDRTLYQNLRRQCSIFGLPADEPPAPTRVFAGGETIAVGRLSATVIHTPGHTPGSVAYYFEADNVLFAGDTLFARSVGRTDLPGGSFPAIVKSIQTKLYVLPPETRVIPGHGSETSIGYERENNPFVRAR